MSDELIKQAAQAETSTEALHILGCRGLGQVMADILADIWLYVEKPRRCQALLDWLRLVEGINRQLGHGG